MTLLLFSLPFFRRLAYEIFLRTHQGLAAACLYSIWRHLQSDSLLPQICVYIPLGVFLLTTLLQLWIFLYRNRIFSSHRYPRALVTCDKDNNGDEKDDDDKNKEKVIKIRVGLARPLEVKAGQYISLWMPSVSLWSWTQTHPFMVTSWSPGKQDTLELFVQTRRGFSADLHSWAAKEGSASFLAFVSGLHGTSEPIGQYESVLAITSGFGIAGVISYLKQLIHGYNTSTSRVRRVHFVWQLRTLGTSISQNGRCSAKKARYCYCSPTAAKQSPER